MARFTNAARAVDRPRGAARRRSELLVAIIAGLVFLAIPEARAQEVGTAKNAIGVLLITRANGTSVRLQGKGDLKLFEGDELKTGPGAQALIEFADGTRVAINEQTTFLIRSRQDPASGLTRILRLLIGELWIKTSAGPRPLEVETPVASAAIRGTEFNMKVLPNGESLLTVVDGLVEFGTPFGSCPIRAGTQSVGERGKRCTRPAPTNVQPAIAWTEQILKP